MPPLVQPKPIRLCPMRALLGRIDCFGCILIIAYLLAICKILTIKFIVKTHIF